MSADLENVLPLIRKAMAEPGTSIPVESIDDVVKTLIAAVEEMDRGLKIMVGLLTEHEGRVRKLELAQRKADRKMVAAIVNAQGERVN